MVPGMCKRSIKPWFGWFTKQPFVGPKNGRTPPHLVRSIPHFV